MQTKKLLFRKIFTKFVNFIERDTIPLSKVLSTFSCIVFVRIFFELFTIKSVPLLFDYYVHMFLFFITLALLLSFVFYFALRKDILSNIRVVFLSFIIIIIVPIIDIFLSKGTGIKLNYLSTYNTPDIIKCFFTLDSYTSMITVSPGIKVEVVIILIVSFLYFKFKGLKLVSNIFFVFLIYTSIFFLGAIPYVFENLFSYLGLARNIPVDIYNYFFIILSFILVCSYFVIYRKQNKLSIFPKGLMPLIYQNVIIFCIGFVFLKDRILLFIYPENILKPFVCLILFFLLTGFLFKIKKQNRDFVYFIPAILIISYLLNATLVFVSLTYISILILYFQSTYPLSKSKVISNIVFPFNQSLLLLMPQLLISETFNFFPKKLFLIFIASYFILTLLLDKKRLNF
jgi:hypothetical protein